LNERQITGIKNKNYLRRCDMMRVTYHGHACWTVSSETHSVIIDPFLTGNELAKIKPSDVKGISAVLVTHGHFDHLGDAVEIAKANNAPVISVFEIVNYVTKRGAQGHPMHIGGAYNFPFGRVKLTIAHHASTTDEGATGNPCGIILQMGGKTLYHAGDTGLFYDMKLIGEMNQIDIALLPIGGNFTMDIDDAVKAVEFLKPKIAIPMHYDTFPVIKADPNEFVKKVEKLGVKGIVLKVEESYEVK
jgi:L-ascorbate metabolism protein UlaG (beta-lactamase superfamily)